MRNAWFIARKDLQYTLRKKETAIWLFLMPIVFFYFIGTVTGGFAMTVGGETRLAVHVPEDAGFLAGEVVRRLKENDFHLYRTATEAEFAKTSPRLTFPPEFTATVLGGETAVLELARSKSGLTQDYDKLRAARACFTVLADLAAAEKEGRPPTAESLAELDALPRGLTLKVKPAGKRLEIPSGFEQAIPGIMVMFTLLVLLTSGATSLVQERSQGLLRRLASAPISQGELVLGKWIGRMILGTIQIVFAFIAGTVLFGFDWGPDLAMVVVVMLGWGALCASLGLLLGNVARTEGQALGIGVLTANVLAAIGGCWWPIEITPDWVQGLQKVVPTGWTMDAMHRLISFRAGAASALPHVLALFGAAILAGWFAARRFRYQ